MADLLRFIPLRVVTLDDVRARLDNDVNAGVDPEDPTFVDTTPGGMYFDITQPLALELERLWDMVSVDVPASMFLETTWGDYLDSNGATINVPRKDAISATGTLTFNGTDGTLIPVGTEVSTIQVDADVDPISFLTTESGTISGGSVTLAVAAAVAGGAGNVPAAAVTLLLSGVAGVASVSNAAAMTGGVDIEADEPYRDRLTLEYSATQGAGSIVDYLRWSLAFGGVGFARVGPLWNGPNTVLVVVTDPENAPVTAAIRDGLQQALDPYDAQTTLNGAVTLPAATIPVHELTGIRDSGYIYINDVLVSYTGRSATSGAGNLTGATGGAGLQADGSPVVQSGSGRGLAPIGSIVTVKSPTTLTVAVDATLWLEDGYSLDGDDGLTIAVRERVGEAVGNYIDMLPAGGENPPGSESPAGSGAVLLNRTRAAFVDVPGVYDVTALSLNGVAADLAVSATQVPHVGTITLTQAP